MTMKEKRDEERISFLRVFVIYYDVLACRSFILMLKFVDGFGRKDTFSVCGKRAAGPFGLVIVQQGRHLSIFFLRICKSQFLGAGGKNPSMYTVTCIFLT